MKKLLLLFSAILFINHCYATTFVVSNLDDSGTGSLRDAIDQAKADPTATAMAPHIIDATGVSGFLDAMSPFSEITTHMIINGPTNSVLSIRRSESSPYPAINLFLVNDAYVFTLNNIRIAKATYTALFINNNALVTLSHCVLDSNSSTGYPYQGGAITIGNGSTVIIDHCVISNNSTDQYGGGIYHSNGTLIIQYSTISNNSSSSIGGGIFSSDDPSSVLKISNSTISGNAATYGGGLYLQNGIDSLINCTISGNVSNVNSGGGIAQDGSNSIVTLISCSVIGNSATGNSSFGGGIFSNTGTMNLSNTIVVGNNAAQGGDEIVGTIYSSFGHNLTGAADADGFVNFISSETSLTKGNVYGTSINTVASTTLAYNGGTGFTHALISSSLARNAGVVIPSLALKDQRDSTRSGVTDIGAFEFRAPAGGVEVITNPSDVIICKGASGSTFTFSTTGTITAYQWQMSTNGGRSYTNITNNSNYNGATTSTLTVNNAPAANNGAKYRCRVTGAETVFSGHSVLHVDVLATIIHDVYPLAVCDALGTSTSAFFQATGNTNSYQWQSNAGTGFSNISDGMLYTGTDQTTLNITDFTGMDGYIFRCQITNSCGSSYTTPSTLNITSPGFNPIEVGLTDQLITAGDKVIFHVVAPKAGGFSWQVAPIINSWSSIPCDHKYASYCSDTTYSNFTLNDSLIINPVSLARDGYYYRCQVGNACGQNFNTEGAELSVRSTPTICMVTVDGSTGKNELVFEKPADQDWIDSFIVYKETTVTNQYAEIGRLSKSAMSTFTDNASDPEQQSNLYKIVVRDTTGHHSLMSPAHQTMHLSINKGTGNTTWNLIWNAYVGINVSSYNIYRGLSTSSMSQIATVSGNILSYTDAAAPNVDDIYYQIEILGASCNPTARTSALTSIVSNFARTAITTDVMNASENTSVKLYPSPSYSGSFTVSVKEGELQEVVLVDMLGKREVFNTSQITTSLRGILVAIVNTDQASYTKKIEVK